MMMQNVMWGEEKKWTKNTEKKKSILDRTNGRDDIWDGNKDVNMVEQRELLK